MTATDKALLKSLADTAAGQPAEIRRREMAIVRHLKRYMNRLHQAERNERLLRDLIADTRQEHAGQINALHAKHTAALENWIALRQWVDKQRAAGQP